MGLTSCYLASAIMPNDEPNDPLVGKSGLGSYTDPKVGSAWISQPYIRVSPGISLGQFVLPGESSYVLMGE